MKLRFLKASRLREIHSFISKTYLSVLSFLSFLTHFLENIIKNQLGLELLIRTEGLQEERALCNEALREAKIHEM